MKDGQTVLLGGLIEADQSRTEGVLPLLGDVSIISSAFRNRTVTNDETMLLILVTPRMVDSVPD